ncbi:DUF2189 domain-containing protein [Halocynthiibacter namhaensis]|uniref:DUF2189 domain-containing protein n=1 Tax=Halocynthiibacter namhaensis TaxID=1290553 RepID=UPI00068B9B57|nr:DUF2189 domain-containing protein [Halocynthiibacter namhaensis]
MTEQILPEASPRPDIAEVQISTLKAALARGFSDFRKAPAFGLFFAAIYVVAGWIMTLITMATGQSYWLVLAVFGFPLIGPFAAIGMYEVSHRIEAGLSLEWREILGVIWRQKDRQIPSVCAIVIFIFLFWFFIAHMIFALFLGTMSLVNVSDPTFFTTGSGLIMLLFGTGVGAALSFFLFSITVMTLPMLLDLEMDYVTAMILSVQTVAANFGVMMFWGLLVGLFTLLGMLSGFIGLLIVLPILGHASWHLYRQALIPVTRRQRTREAKPENSAK